MEALLKQLLFEFLSVLSCYLMGVGDFKLFLEHLYLVIIN